MQSRKKMFSWLFAVLLVMGLCAWATSGQGQNESPIKHQLESFTFVNETGATADGLILILDGKKVMTKDAGAFGKAVSPNETIMFSKGTVAPCASTRITLEREGAFQILSWQWMSNGAGVGGVRPGTPGLETSPPPVNSSPCNTGVRPGGPGI